LKLIKCWVGPNSEVMTNNPEVSTSVTMDWEPGLVIEN